MGDSPVSSVPPAGSKAAEPRPYSAEDWRTLWRRRPLLVFGGGGILAFAVAVLWLSWGLPLGKALAPLESPTLVLVTDDGQAFARRGSYKEPPVDVRTLPKHVPMAFVAIEDRRFYRHIGVDARAIGRALNENVRAGEIEQGGSTITQQLAKNAFLDREQSYRRKAREAMIAVYLEAVLSKDQILSRYLSGIYFGDGVFGLRAAARHYFDKAPEVLTPGEAAMLAGLVKAPSKLNPTENLAGAKARMLLVLDEMASLGVISEAEAKTTAKAVKLKTGRPELPVGSYFADWVSAKAKLRFDRGYGEVAVKTTLDAGLQQRAEKAVASIMRDGDKLHATQAALVAMRTDGRVVAMVGGRDYRKSQFNRAAQAKRQPGSAFKPVVYLAALRAGASPDSMVLDAPIRIGDWSPQNHEANYSGGPITLRRAFANSSNVAAVRLGQSTGQAAMVKAARDLGITAELPNDPTIALGTASLSLIELTSAYASIAAGTSPVTPRGLADTPAEPIRARLNARERDGLLDLMDAVVHGGTGSAADPGVPAFGKTGTSQDYRDAWFIGFAGDLVIGVWVGNDDNTPMKRVVGGNMPARIFRDVMTYAQSRKEFQGGPVTNFTRTIQVADAVPMEELFPYDEPIETVVLPEFDDRDLPPFMRFPPPPRAAPFRMPERPPVEDRRLRPPPGYFEDDEDLDVTAPAYRRGPPSPPLIDEGRFRRQLPPPPIDEGRFRRPPPPPFDEDEDNDGFLDDAVG